MHAEIHKILQKIGFRASGSDKCHGQVRIFDVLISHLDYNNS